MAEKGHSDAVIDAATENVPPNSTAAVSLTARSPVPRFDLLSDDGDNYGTENQMFDTSSAQQKTESGVAETAGDDEVVSRMSLLLTRSVTQDDTHSNESGYPWSRPQSVPDDELEPLRVANLSRLSSQVDSFELGLQAPSSTLSDLQGMGFRHANIKESLHKESTGILKRNSICVFDLRASDSAVVQGNELMGIFPSDEEHLKVMLSQRYSTPRDCIIILSPEFLRMGKIYGVVVSEGQKSKLKLFLSENLMEHVVSQFSPQLQYCVCVDGSTTPKSLEQVVESSLRNVVNIRFMWNKTLLQDGSLAQYGIQDLDTLNIIRVKPMAVKILHRSSTFNGQYYVLDVLNTDSLEDLQRKFLLRFASQFPSVASGSEVLFFTQGTSLLKNGDHPFLEIGAFGNFDSSDDSDSDGFDGIDQLAIHAKPVGAVKAILSFRLDGAKMIQKVAILVPPSASPALVRLEVSRFCHKPANSLKILVQGKKIRSHERISQCPDFRPDCSIVAELQPKMDIQVLVQFLPGGQQRRLMVSSYKHDSLGSVRAELARALHVDPFHLSLKLQEGQPLEDFKSVRECRLRHGDEITAVVHEKRAMIRVRKPAKINDVLLVDDTSCTTVQQIADFIQQRHGLKNGNVYLLCCGRRLRNADTLEAASVQSGNMLLVCCERRPLPSNLHFLFESVDRKHINKIIQIVAPSGERFQLQVHDDSDISRMAAAFAPAGASTVSEPPSIPGVWVLSRDPSSAVSGPKSAPNPLGRSSSSANIQVSECPTASSPSLSYTSMPSPIARNMATPKSVKDSPFDWSKSVSYDSPQTSSPSFYNGSNTAARNTSAHHSLGKELQPQQTSGPSLSRSRSFTFSTPATTPDRSRHTSESQTASRLPGEKILAFEIIRRELIERDSQQFIKKTNIQEQLVGKFRGLSIDGAPGDIFPLSGAVSHAEHPSFHHSNTVCDFTELPGVVETEVLVAVAKQLGSEWEIFAITLGVQQYTLDQIKGKYPNNMYLQALGALCWWKQCKGKDATPAALKAKLLKNDLRLIAESVDNIQEVRYLTS